MPQILSTTKNIKIPRSVTFLHVELGAIDIQAAGQVYQGVSLPTSVETEYVEESVGLRGEERFIDNHTAGERERSVLKVRADVTHLWRYASHNWWSMICNTREILLLSNLSTDFLQKKEVDLGPDHTDLS